MWIVGIVLCCGAGGVGSEPGVADNGTCALSAQPAAEKSKAPSAASPAFLCMFLSHDRCSREGIEGVQKTCHGPCATPLRSDHRFARSNRSQSLRAGSAALRFF